VTGGHRDLPGSPYRPTPDDGQRSTLLAGAARYAQPLSDSLSLMFSAGARDDHLSVWIAPYPGVRQRDTQLSGSSELVWSAGPSTASLRVGVTTEQLTSDGAPSHSRNGIAFTLADDLQLASGRLRISPALRWEAQGPFDGTSGSLGATWRVSGPFSVRASLARTFRVPSFAELYLTQGTVTPNPDLVPESSWSVDAGVAADGRLGLVALTFFSHSYQDLIVYEPDSFRRLKPFNDGKAEAQGLEIELVSAPMGPLGLVASGAYTYLDSQTLRGDEGVLGKQLPHLARHRLFARLAAGPPAVNGHVEAHYLSEQYQDLRNSPGLRVPPSLTFNAGASVRLFRSPETRLGLEIRNVLDDRSLQDGFGNPLPGRMVMVTLRLAGEKEKG
jgi:outer membrane receptor protein involved in Fe transport